MKENLYNQLFTTSGTLTIENVIMNFLAACLLSVLIYVAYKVSHATGVYSRKFNVSLIMLTLVTTLVMNVIGNNIALSLGMVGALSIVRFRTAIKDPRDTAFIFWCIAVGICCGVSDYLIAGIGTLIIFIFLIIFGIVRDNERIMIVLKIKDDALQSIDHDINDYFGGKCIMKVQNVTKERSQAEIIYETSEKVLKKCQKKKGLFISEFTDKAGVSSVSIVRQDEEINQ